MMSAHKTLYRATSTAMPRRQNFRASQKFSAPVTLFTMEVVPIADTLGRANRFLIHSAYEGGLVRIWESD
jgi:hypothetical protein